MMVVFSEDHFAWTNARLICWECDETTWKSDERMHTRMHTGQAGYNIARWWTCKECWKCA